MFVEYLYGVYVGTWLTAQDAATSMAS